MLDLSDQLAVMCDSFEPYPATVSSMISKLEPRLEILALTDIELSQHIATFNH
jgi:hypothetical protein